MERNATPDYQLSISKEALAKLPVAHFHGSITVVEDAEASDKAIIDLRQAQVIGFDTETRPSFRKGQSNNVALMQLSTRFTSYLFRLNKLGLVESLKMLLEDESILKIGLSIHDDFHNLNKIAAIEPKGFIDLQNFVKQYRIADNSLARIYGIIFNKRISKGQRLTNWEADSLTTNQQSYAALDALACIDIYDEISSGRFNPELCQYRVYPSEETEAKEREYATSEITAPEKQTEDAPQPGKEPQKPAPKKRTKRHSKKGAAAQSSSDSKSDPTPADDATTETQG